MGKPFWRSVEYFFTGNYSADEGNNTINAIGFGGKIYAYGGDDHINLGSIGATVYTGEGNDTVSAGAGYLRVDDTGGNLTVRGAAGYADINKSGDGSVVFQGAAGAVDIEHTGLHGKVDYAGAAAYNNLVRKGESGGMTFKGAGGYNSLWHETNEGDLSFNGAGAGNKIDRTWFDVYQGSHGNVAFYGAGAANSISSRVETGNIFFAGAGADNHIVRRGKIGDITMKGAGASNRIERSCQADDEYADTQGNVTFEGAGGYNRLYSDVAHGNIHFSGAGAYNEIIRKGTDSDFSSEGLSSAKAEQIVLTTATMNGRWIGYDQPVTGMKSATEANTYIFAFADKHYTKINKVQLSNNAQTGKLEYFSTAWYKEGNHLENLAEQDISTDNGFTALNQNGAYTLSDLTFEHQQPVTIHAIEKDLTENQWITYGDGALVMAENVVLAGAKMSGDSIFNNERIFDVSAVKSHRKPNTYVYGEYLEGYTKIVVVELANDPETGVLKYLAKAWYKTGDHTADLASTDISTANGYQEMGTGGYSLSDLQYSVTTVRSTSDRVEQTQEYNRQALVETVSADSESSGDVRFEGAGGGNVIKSNVTHGDVDFQGGGIANVIQHGSAFGDTKFIGGGAANVIVKSGKLGDLTFQGAGLANVLVHQGQKGKMNVKAGGAANVLVRVGDGEYLAHLLALGNISVHRGDGQSRVTTLGGFNTHTQIGNGHATWLAAGGFNVMTQKGRGETAAVLAGGVNVLSKIGDGNLFAGVLGGANIVTHIHGNQEHSDTTAIALGGANVLTKKGEGDLVAVMGGGANVLTQVGNGETISLMAGGANVLTKVGDGDTTGVMLGIGNVMTHVGEGQTLGVMGAVGNVFTKVGDGTAIAAMAAAGNVYTHVGDGDAWALMGGMGNVFTKVGNGRSLALMVAKANVFTHIGSGMSVALMLAQGNLATKVGNGSTLAAMVGNANIFTHIGQGDTFAAMIGQANILTKVGNELTAGLLVGKANVMTHVGNGTSLGLFAGEANVMTKVGQGTTLAAMFGKANMMTHIGDGLTGVLALGEANIVTKVGDDFMGVVAASKANVMTHVGDATTAAVLGGHGNIMTKVGDGTTVGLLLSKVGNVMTHVGDGTTVGFAKGKANLITKVGEGLGINASWGNANVLTHVGDGDRFNFAKGDVNVVTKVGDGQEVSVVQGTANVITHVGDGDDYTGAWGKANVITKVGDGRNVVLAKGEANVVTQIGNGDSFNALWSKGNIVTKVGDGLQVTAAKGQANITTTVGNGVSVTAAYGDANINTIVGDGQSVNVAWGKLNVNTKVGDGLNVAVMKGKANANIHVGDGLGVNASYAQNNVAIKIGNGDFYSLAVAASNTQSSKLSALFDNIKQTVLGVGGSQAISYLVNGNEVSSSGTRQGRGAIDLVDVSSIDGFQMEEIDQVSSDLSGSLSSRVTEVEAPDIEQIERALSGNDVQAELGADSPNLITNGDFSLGGQGWQSTHGIEADFWASAYGIETKGQDSRVSELATDRNTTIYQDLEELKEGSVIALDFDFAKREGISAENGMEVIWNGVTVFSSSGDETVWQQQSLELTAKEGTNRIEFKGTGENDGLGYVLDNVIAKVQSLPQTFSNGLSEGEQSNLIVDGNFELGGQGWQSTHGIEAYASAEAYGVEEDGHGQHVSELATDRNTTLYQDIKALAEGEIIALNFDFAKREGISADKGIDVIWNGEIVFSSSGDESEWQHKTVQLTAKAGSNRIEFKGTGQSDGLGYVLDNVVATSEGLPLSNDINNYAVQDAAANNALTDKDRAEADRKRLENEKEKQLATLSGTQTQLESTDQQALENNGQLQRNALKSEADEVTAELETMAQGLKELTDHSEYAGASGDDWRAKFAGDLLGHVQTKLDTVKETAEESLFNAQLTIADSQEKAQAAVTQSEVAVMKGEDHRTNAEQHIEDVETKVRMRESEAMEHKLSAEQAQQSAEKAVQDAQARGDRDVLTAETKVSEVQNDAKGARLEDGYRPEREGAAGSGLSGEAYDVQAGDELTGSVGKAEAFDADGRYSQDLSDEGLTEEELAALDAAQGAVNRLQINAGVRMTNSGSQVVSGLKGVESFLASLSPASHDVRPQDVQVSGINFDGLKKTATQGRADLFTRILERYFDGKAGSNTVREASFNFHQGSDLLDAMKHVIPEIADVLITGGNSTAAKDFLKGVCFGLSARYLMEERVHGLGGGEQYLNWLKDSVNAYNNPQSSGQDFNSVTQNLLNHYRRQNFGAALETIMSMQNSQNVLSPRKANAAYGGRLKSAGLTGPNIDTALMHEKTGYEDYMDSLRQVDESTYLTFMSEDHAMSVVVHKQESGTTWSFYDPNYGTKTYQDYDSFRAFMDKFHKPLIKQYKFEENTDAEQSFTVHFNRFVAGEITDYDNVWKKAREGEQTYLLRALTEQGKEFKLQKDLVAKLVGYQDDTLSIEIHTKLGNTIEVELSGNNLEQAVEWIQSRAEVFDQQESESKIYLTLDTEGSLEYSSDGRDERLITSSDPDHQGGSIEATKSPTSSVLERAYQVVDFYRWLEVGDPNAQVQTLKVPGVVDHQADVFQSEFDSMVEHVAKHIEENSALPRDSIAAVATLFVQSTLQNDWNGRLTFLQTLEQFGYAFEPVQDQRTVAAFSSSGDPVTYRDVLSQNGQQAIFEHDIPGMAFANDLNKQLVEWGAIHLSMDEPSDAQLMNAISASTDSNSGFWKSVHAAGTQGDAYVVTDGRLRIDNAFWNTELPVLRQLQREGLVGEIRLLDKPASEYEGVPIDRIGHRLTDTEVTISARFDSLNPDQKMRVQAENPDNYQPDSVIELNVRVDAMDDMLRQSIPFYGLRTDRNLLLQEGNSSFVVKDLSRSNGVVKHVIVDAEDDAQLQTMERFILANFDDFSQLPEELHLVDGKVLSFQDGRTRILAQKVDGVWEYKPKTELMTEAELVEKAHVTGKRRGESYQNVIAALAEYHAALNDYVDYAPQAVDKLLRLQNKIEGYLLGHPDSARVQGVKALQDQVNVRVDEVSVLAGSGTTVNAQSSFSRLYDQLENANLKSGKHLYLDSDGNIVTRGKGNVTQVDVSFNGQDVVDRVKASVAKEYGQSLAEEVFTQLTSKDLAKDGKGLDISGLQNIHRSIEQAISPFSATLYVWKPSEHSRLGHTALQIGQGRTHVKPEDASAYNQNNYVSWWPLGRKTVSPTGIQGVPAAPHETLAADMESEENNAFGLESADIKLTRFIEKMNQANGISAKFKDVTDVYAMAALSNPDMLASAGIEPSLYQPFVEQWNDTNNEPEEVSKNFADTLRRKANQSENPQALQRRIDNVVRLFAEREMEKIETFKMEDADEGRVFRINLEGLDVAAMQSEWQKIRNQPDARYQLLTKNCSSTVAKVLKAGGADKLIGHSWRPKFGVWTPTELYNYGQALQEAQLDIATMKPRQRVTANELQLGDDNAITNAVTSEQEATPNQDGSHKTYQSRDLVLEPIQHPKSIELGMPEVDQSVLAEVAERENVIIGVRPVDEKSKSLIASKMYSSKGLFVKAKSSDWGPMSGFIPVDQSFAKASARRDLEKFNEYAEQSILSGNAVSANLYLNQVRIEELVSKYESLTPLELDVDSGMYKTTATNGDQTIPFFLNKVTVDDKELWQVHYLREGELAPFKVIGDPVSKQPMTADYDLLTVMYTYGDLGPQDKVKQPLTWEQWKESVTYEDLSPKYKARYDNQALYEKQDGASLGMVSDRLKELKDVINTSLGRTDGLEMVHHGADDANPYAVMADNFPATFFVPKHFFDDDGLGEGKGSIQTYFNVNEQGAVVIQNPQEFSNFQQVAINASYRASLNDKWNSGLDSPLFTTKRKLSHDYLDARDEVAKKLGLTESSKLNGLGERQTMSPAQNSDVNTWARVDVSPLAGGGETRFGGQIIIQTENDAIVSKAAASLAGKHPENSVVVQLDVEGNYRVVYGDVGRLSGAIRWQIVGHGRDASESNHASLSGHNADDLADKLTKFNQDFSQSESITIKPDHISVVGCSLVSNDKQKGFAHSLISALDAKGIRSSVSARSHIVDVNPETGRKYTLNNSEHWEHKQANSKVVLHWNEQGEVVANDEPIRQGVAEGDIDLSLVGLGDSEPRARGAIADNTDVFMAPEKRTGVSDVPMSASDNALSYSGNIQVNVGDGEFSSINWGTSNVGIKVGTGGVKSLSFGDNNVMVHIGNGDSQHSIDIEGYQALEGAQMFVGTRNVSFNLGRSNDLIVMTDKSIPTPPLVNPFDGASRISGVLQGIAYSGQSQDWLTAQEQQWTLSGAKKFVQDMSGLDQSSSVDYATLVDLDSQNERSSRGLRYDVEATLNKQYNQWLGSGGNSMDVSSMNRADKFRQANDKLAFNFAVGGQGADIQVTAGNWNFMFGDNIQSILDTNLGSLFGLMTQQFSATGQAKSTFTFGYDDLPRQLKNRLLGKMASIGAETTLGDVFGVDYTADGRIVSRSEESVDGVAILKDMLEVIGEFSGDQLQSFVDPAKLLDSLKSSLDMGSDSIQSFAESHGLKEKAPQEQEDNPSASLVVGINEGSGTQDSQAIAPEKTDQAFGFNALNLPNLFATMFSEEKRTEMKSLVANLKENLTADLMNMQEETFDFLRNSGHLQGDGDINVSLGNYNFNWGGDGRDLGAYLGDNNNFWGGRGDDVYYATGTSNLFTGGEGQDMGVLMGRENMMFGGDGNDTAVIAGRINHAFMGAGDDQSFVFGEGGEVSTDAGRDYAVISGNFNRIDMGGDQDYSVTIGNNNQAELGGGDDFANAFGNYNRINGSDGNDVIKLMGYHAVLDGGEDDDRLIASAIAKFSQLDGGNGQDVMVLGGYQNTFKGGDGVDSFIVSGAVIDNLVEDIRSEDNIVFNGIDWQDLWFERSGYDLKLSVLRNSQALTEQVKFESVGSVTFADYFNGNRAELVIGMGEKDAAGERSYTALSNNAVDALVQAMSSFAPQVGNQGFIDHLDNKSQVGVTTAWADVTHGKGVIA
ncbi:putative Adenylate cyclase [Vibrio nigripulchritudo SFn27]|uniref:MARTX n=1 Tax=Vibrio nigripulchritudo TaxID=28173 RepID=A0A9P1NJI6_9VIBR|nr:MARTX multifunctional-autoprocessing repeats-in-toxin holotoxin RtxA [Vibrio nigripulchritudo]CBJ93227.1 MARTX [Vibrio nigripulchritudo]CCN86051.1 putative Adenylate cyclase [Vibrio nigripulchritudo BLFn1]CCN92038.1 putative Adenylate cyclase [Vibrio nigripulchritudo SFn27]CCN97849.1 putative Adenylate cyclase [Vibrio nigripulchritudo ENn2]CCO44072.1 putative Adenylate cyclase [Vibrio nigripulchritudo SFn135]